MTFMDLVREESAAVKNGRKPNYLVVAERTSVGLLSSEAAIFWHGVTHGIGLNTTIVDCTGYDWDKNPANIQMHDTAEDALLAIASTTGIH